jgi:hypothetical protein
MAGTYTIEEETKCMYNFLVEGLMERGHLLDYNADRGIIC